MKRTKLKETINKVFEKELPEIYTNYMQGNETSTISENFIKNIMVELDKNVYICKVCNEIIEENKYTIESSKKTVYLHHDCFKKLSQSDIKNLME